MLFAVLFAGNTVCELPLSVWTDGDVFIGLNNQSGFEEIQFSFWDNWFDKVNHRKQVSIVLCCVSSRDVYNDE